jgi:hypothetical protein
MKPQPWTLPSAVTEWWRVGVGYGRITKSSLPSTGTADMNTADVAGAAFFFYEEFTCCTARPTMHVTLPLNIRDVTPAASGYDTDRDS